MSLHAMCINLIAYSYKNGGYIYQFSLRWPLIIDTNQQAATFLRYRDTNYLNVCSPKNMETDTIRMALLGAIRLLQYSVHFKATIFFFLYYSFLGLL